MTTNLFDRFFRIDQFSGYAAQARARLLYRFTLILLVTYTLFITLAPDQSNVGTVLAGAIAQTDVAADNFVIGIIATYSFGLVTLLLLRAGRTNTAAYTLLATQFFATIWLSFNVSFNQPESSGLLAAWIVIAGLFLYQRGVILGFVSCVAFVVIGQYTALGSNVPLRMGSLFTVIIVLFGISVLVYLFIRFSKLETIDARASVAEERLKLASITTQIAGLISRHQALSSVLDTTINAIVSGYPIVYHAQIFLIDASGENAKLAASTGEVGQLLLKRQHSLPVGSQSVIGRVTATGQTVIARAGAPDGIHKYNPLLPETLVEVAFPLRIGDRVIGVLDVQSRELESFLEPEIPVFEALADTVAVAIDNARLYDERERQLIENRGLVDQMQGAMGEVERLNRQLTGMAWMDFLQGGRDRVNLDYAPARGLSTNAVWTPTLREAATSGAIVQHNADNQQIVSVPVRVRGVVIGAAEFVVPGGALTPDELALAQSVIERFGAAAEALRLYEDAQRATMQEQRVNDIAARYQQVNNVDDLLSITVAELSQTLGAKRGAIRLGRLTPETAGSPAKPNGTNGAGRQGGQS